MTRRKDESSCRQAAFPSSAAGSDDLAAASTFGKPLITVTQFARQHGCQFWCRQKELVYISNNNWFKISESVDTFEDLAVRNDKW